MAALAVAIVQQSLMHRFSHGYISFDLIALTAAFVAFHMTGKGGLWAVLFLGVLRDLGSTGRLGAGALCFLPAVLLMWALKERFFRRTMVSGISFAFLFMLASGALYAAGMIAFSPAGASYRYLYHAAASATFTAILVPLFFVCFRLAGIIEQEKTVF